ncbi:hypothetical protein Poli38472_009306 [Pythium oligandrum]|uniref:Uncharacterized protein n=1 Tax=Pythium oligandrum TaxID=41045 RepID=A0A8K1CKD0_PYTOL|nr:hypothetical protein Poli38472_009306 [Pythium oligandrum]|eukprot:TMW65139.1 hypothetical protein Poli38472_009306 [Pythium oligandrum]
MPSPTSSSDGLRRKVRFLDREGRFRQSMGRYNIKRVGGDWRRIYTDDLFHTVINTRTSRIATGIFLAYALVIFFFALAYLDISMNRQECHVGIKTLMEAYIFSLETIMTIGYGAPTNDIFYGGCSTMAVLLTLESFAGIFLDSICIGMFYARFARANKRAQTVMFSNTAVIRKIRGEYYFMLQVCERRKHQLVEAHVRLYAMRHVLAHDGSPDMLYQSHQMRVQQPDDDTGAMLLIALPQVIVHRIDPWSPLFPPECLPTEGHYPRVCPSYPDPSQRMIDIENGNRDGGADVPYKKPTRMQIMNHLRKTELEVIVVLEGIDGSTSNTMQARHSYTDEEIAWDSTFENCVSKTPEGVLINFDRFHLLRPAPEDTEHWVSPSTF